MSLVGRDWKSPSVLPYVTLRQKCAFGEAKNTMSKICVIVIYNMESLTNWKADNVSIYWSCVSISTRGRRLKSYLTTSCLGCIREREQVTTAPPWSPRLTSLIHEYSHSPVLLQTWPAEQQWVHLGHNCYSASASLHHNVMSRCWLLLSFNYHHLYNYIDNLFSWKGNGLSLVADKDLPSALHFYHIPRTFTVTWRLCKEK